jgi:anti-sigma-K factor RskA
MSDHDLHHEMGDGTGSDDTESLLGAYVLDALDDVERRRVERLLATDPAARAEVDRLEGAVDQLAETAAEGASAPSGLLGSIMAQVAERPQGAATAPTAPTRPPAVEPVLTPRFDPARGTASGSPDVVSLEERASARRTRAPWILSAAAVVALFVVGALVVGSRDDDGVQDPIAAMEQLAADAATLPGARTGQLTDAGNTMAVQVVVDPEGHAFVMSGVLPALPADQTYQLWAVDGGTPVSLGLLGHDPTMSVVGVDGRVENLAITIESAGGSAAPTQTPMASGTLQQA